jgi:hypothetical protein
MQLYHDQCERGLGLVFDVMLLIMLLLGRVYDFGVLWLNTEKVESGSKQNLCNCEKGRSSHV